MTTQRQKNAALHVLAEWHQHTPPVPSQITAHEAHRLTDGATGVEGDHGTPVRRIDAAMALAKVRTTKA